VTSPSAPRGCIFDTHAKPPSPKGRFDLVVYDDGLLALHGNYRRPARTQGTGEPPAGVSAVPMRGHDLKRFTSIAGQSRDELLARHPSNHLLATSDITGLHLRRRWTEHVLRVEVGGEERTYRWKPRLNRPGYVIDLLSSTFGSLFKME